MSTETTTSNPFGCEFALNTLVRVTGESRLQGELGTVSDVLDQDLVDVWFPATCELHRFFTEDLVAVL